MRHTPRLGYAGARRGLIATLIVAATYAGPVAAGADGPAPADTTERGGTKTADDVAVAAPGVAPHTLDGSIAEPPPPPTPEQRAAAGDPGERLGGEPVEAQTGGGQRYLVVVEEQHTLDAAIAALGITPTDYWNTALYGFAARLTPSQAAQLRATPGVTTVEPDGLVQAFTDQTNPPWGLDRIDQRTSSLDAKYSYKPTGAGVTAYVIDTGLWLSHTEFAGRTAPGAYAIDDGWGVWDCNGHGTHVAGTIGGTTYGVAKQVTIVPVRVLDCGGSGSISGVVAGIDWVAGHHTPGIPAVANLSLGMFASPSTSAMDAAVDALIEDGVTVVVAAGNDTMATCDFSPARVPGAITVAASDENDDAAWFSNYGVCNDLFAPGVGIVSAYPSAMNTATEIMDGTSMAAPHVAGAAALILQGSPSATPAEVWEKLDAATTTGAVTECCGEPDKLLYIDALAPTLWMLTVSQSGTGSGTVMSNPAGISCASSCSAAFTSDASVTLTATPSIGSRFAGWSDACVGTSTSCSVSMTDARSVTATFAPDALITVNPSRVYDSRDGAGPGPAGSITVVQISGAGTVPLGATGVVLNVTAVEAQAAGFLAVFPCDEAVPDASNLNYAAGQTIPNAVFAKLGGDGTVCIYTDAVAHLIVDVNGYLPAGSDITPVAPTRFYDSRTGDGPRPDGSVTHITVTGRPGFPMDSTAVTLNVTAVDAQSAGFMTVFPCENAIPEASNLNFAAGQTIANAVVARVGTGGQVCVYVSGSAGLIVDVNGFVPAGSNLIALNPARLFDSRTTGGARSEGSVTEVPVAGLGGVASDAKTALLNVTAIDASTAGFMTVFPCGNPVPTASNVNYSAGQTIPNAVVAKIGDGGRVCIYTSATAGLIVDVNGFVA